MTSTSRERRRTKRPAAAAGGRPKRLPLAGEALVFAVLWVPPLLVLPTLADAFDLPKLLAAEWLGLASLALLAWRLREVERIGARRLGAVPALAAALPLVAVFTVGLATSPHPAQVGAALPDLWIGAACLVGWSAGLSDRAHRRLQIGLLPPAGVLALLAILQVHDLYRPFTFAGGEEATRLGVSSLAGNAGVLAAYLVLPALIAQRLLHRAWRRGRWAPAAAVGVVLALCLYGLAVTQTLAAVAATAAASAVLWLGLLPPRRAALALGSVALAAAVAMAAVPALRSRVVDKAGDVAGGRLNRALTGRLDGWRAAVWMLAERPWTGVGPGAYSAEFAAAKLDLAAGGAEFLGGADRPMFANAHNDLLEVGAVAGVPGLAALGWALWRLLAGLGRRGPGRGSPADGPAAVDRREDLGLAWAGLVGLTVLALFHFPFHVGLVAFPALLFLAWSYRLGGEREG